MKFDLVKVKWIDAQTGFSQSMQVSEFLEHFEPFYNYSIGHLLCNDKDKIILGFLIMMDSEEDPLVKHWQLIPKGMVKEIIKLKDGGKK